MAGRHRKYSPELEARIRAEYELGRQNRADLICFRWGISHTTLHKIVRNRAPQKAKRPRGAVVEVAQDASE